MSNIVFHQGAAVRTVRTLFFSITYVRYAYVIVPYVSVRSLHFRTKITYLILCNYHAVRHKNTTKQTRYNSRLFGDGQSDPPKKNYNYSPSLSASCILWTSVVRSKNQAIVYMFTGFHQLCSASASDSDTLSLC